ncbi:HD domain-containing protein [Gammaproteobacteria bacterium]|nr:HD domain-containing protein [Gammaproteobacteria bacterium]
MPNKNLFHVIKDPVHGTMQFTAKENLWIKPFIDSPQLQRLRHIKQLGMGDYIFPGAVHTRFNHSLGCCFVSSQIAKKIGLNESEQQLTMLACLLHDIGHGPFSHAFEDLFYKKLIQHEDWTPYFLKEYENNIFFKEYNKVNLKNQLSKDKFIFIEKMIMHKTKKNNLLADIVSSQLDADRLDYLLRDSHFCGVRYGEFDFKWMLNSLAIIKTKKGKRLGLTHKGIGVAEHYLMARRLMTRNIYLHQKKLAIEDLMVKLLTNLSENLQNNSEYESIKNTRLGAFLSSANEFNQKIKASIKINNLKKIFIENNFHNYKELADYDVFLMINFLAKLKSNHPAAQIAQRLHLRQIPKIIPIDHSNIAKLEELLKDFKHCNKTKIQDWQLSIIKTPHKSYDIEDDPILIMNEHNLITPLNNMSLMINAIGNKLEHTAFLSIDKMIYKNRNIQKFCGRISNTKL